MRNKIFVIVIIILIGVSSTIFSQTQFRSGRFFHHSTGNRIWGPNGSSTSIPNEMTLYNTQKGYTGNNSVSMNETWFPSDDNEWYTWHRIFDNSDPNDNIYPYLQNNKIVVIKSCYPSSEMVGAGSPADTLNNPSIKTIYNYKWHWRSIIRKMEQHPDNFFVIWTNAPLVPNATNSQEASLADQFCTWAKDTLAAGNDPIFGEFPLNVYVFDFFHKLADANGMLQLQYATSTTDSHPNGLATELVSPQFVQEIFNAAIAYESLTVVEDKLDTPLTEYVLEQNYPNPFNPTTKISWQSPVSSWQTIRIYNLLGKEVATLVNEYHESGSYEINFNASNLPSGVYLYKLQIGYPQGQAFVITKKMILLR